MAKGLVSDTNLTAIANAIRAKNGESDAYTPAEMAQAISDIPTSQVDQESALKYMLENKTDYTGIAAGLTTLTELPEFTQPSGVKNFYGAFSNCRSLQRIEHLDVSSSNSSFQNMFYYCQNLTYVPDLDTVGSGSRSAESMFYYCQSLANLPALKWNTFNSCRNMLCRVPIISFDETISVSGTYSGIENFASMFSGCTSLNSVTLRGRGFKPTVNFASMFSGCTSLTSVEFLQHPSVSASASIIKPTTSTNCASMFYNCSSLSNISSSVTDIVLVAGVPTVTTSMFSGCTSLTSIALGSNMNSATNCAGMFKGCAKLVDVAQMNLSAVSSDEYSTAGYGTSGMFQNCPALSSDALNNILASLTTASKITTNKTLKYIGLTSAQATTCTGLSNWAALSAAGWTTGY